MTDLTYPNEVQPFSLEGANVRGRLVRLGQAYADILDPHNYPSQVGGLMGELSAMTVALADSLKYDGLFILQTQSDGPVAMMVVDVTSEGTMRGYARYDADKLNKESSPTVPHLMGSGHLAFTVDQGQDMERYQGITALEGASLAECAQSYFRQSEQLETAILLAADPETKRAAALMIQKMPATGGTGATDQHLDLTQEEEDERWRNAVVLMSSMTPSELLDPSLSSGDLLYRLYHEDGVRLYDNKPLKFLCRCSGEKVAATLASFPEEDLNEMKTDEGLIVATCEFCRTDYKFDDAALAAARNPDN